MDRMTLVAVRQLFVMLGLGDLIVFWLMWITFVFGYIGNLGYNKGVGDLVCSWIHGALGSIFGSFDLWIYGLLDLGICGFLGDSCWFALFAENLQQTIFSNHSKASSSLLSTIVLAKSRCPISDIETRQKKTQCYADIESVQVWEIATMKASNSFALVMKVSNTRLDINIQHLFVMNSFIFILDCCTR
ncbi:uncharacterized protein LOC112179754 [Rosa chinensis]|uniref:uncharacterized protein LOC112179754 n=1 Tax=Rosa chinensis TaxID=74649 RepID=UPI001AD91D8A|nr:uncharacterized protein LOC112179754 [Rosa chinensis]